MKVKIGPYPKSNKSQKISVEIDGHDTFSLDHTLPFIILPALSQLKDTMHGIPGEFANVGGEDHTIQMCFDFYQESHNDAFDKGCKRWYEVLDKMIWSFEQLVKNDYDVLYHYGKLEFDWIKTDKTFPNPVTGKMEETFEMVDKNPNGNFYDLVGHQLHEDRIQEGLELFGKYFRTLWD